MVHPSAIVHPQARVHPTACVGPWCLLDAGAELGPDVVLESRVHVYGGTVVGAGTRVFDGAILGADPQDLKYRGEPTGLLIGEKCLVREYCTLNRGTGERGLTRIGNSVLLMAYVHVGHDCTLGQGAVLANGVQLGGHVRIDAFATLGGNTAVQQFAHVGAYSFVGGTLKVDRDVPPASKALGNPLRWGGLNLHALRRHGFAAERIALFEAFYKGLYRSSLSMEDYLAQGSASVDPALAAFFTDWNALLIRP